MRYRPLSISLLMVSFLCLFLSAAQAQKITGTITGTITDSTGAVVPQATVDVVNAATNARRSVKSNGQGSYSFPELDPGTYILTVNKTGFKQVTERSEERRVGKECRSR